jgi:hypothetical protein
MTLQQDEITTFGTISGKHFSCPGLKKYAELRVCISTMNTGNRCSKDP